MKIGNAERRRGGYHLIYFIILPYEERPVNTVNSGVREWGDTEIENDE